MTFKVVADQQLQLLDLVQTGKRLTPSSSTVNDNFVIIVRPDADMERLVTSDVERALQAWHDLGLKPAQASTLSIDVGQTNLRVYCSWHLEPEHLERFVNLGVSLAKALKSDTSTW